MRRVACLPLVALLCACGGAGGGSSGGPRGATLLLDFTPNAAHAGIYVAVARGYDRRAGVRLRVRVPGASTDALKLLEAGRTDLAILDIHDLGLAREQGRDVVGVMAVVQRPLAAVLAQRSVRRPRELAGRRVGVSGLPSDVAVLHSIVAGDGGDPARLREVTIGFEAVKALLAHRVDAATAFWDVEGVELGDRVREFRVDDYGAPSYPELVLCTTRQTLQRRAGLVRAVIRALRHGYTVAQHDPGAAIRAMTSQVRGLDAGPLRAQLSAVAPAFTAGVARYGQLRPAVLRAWAAWDRRFGILHHPLDVRAAFDDSLAGP